MITNYLFELGKIIQGAANADLQAVAAYGTQLADRLEGDGEVEAAKRVRQILGKSKAQKFTLSRLGSDQQSAPPLPVDAESRLTIADEEIFPKGQVECFLTPSTWKVVERFLAFFHAAGRLIAHGVGVSASMLVYGPPGCGKTQLARYVASELGLPLITARIDGLISSYLGSTAKNLRALFDYAASRPCVLFLDEFDALAKMRDDARELGELKRVVISLLQNIDALGGDHVLMAATNHDHLLDPAIWRRFSYRVKLDKPDYDARMKMASAFFHGFATDDVAKAVALLADEMTGAQLRQAAEDSVRAAVVAGSPSVSLAEAVAAVLGASPKMSEAAAGPLGERVKMARSLNSGYFTQARLAEVFGVSQATVSRLLKGGSDGER